MAQVVIDGVTYTSDNSANPYGEIAQAYANQYRQRVANQQAQMLNQLNQSKNSTNKSYESNAAQAYINYAKQKNSMNEMLAQRGINGGASESTLARVQNNYAQDVSNNNSSRSAALSELQKAYDTNIANMNSEMEAAIAANNAQMAQMQAQYQDTLNQRALEQYQATMGRYTSAKQIDKAIKKLNPNDPNYTAMKQLLQLRKAELKGAKGGSGGGGGSSKGYSSKSYSNNNNNSNNDNNNSKNAPAGSAMDAYYKANANKMKNYKNTRTTNVGGKKKSGYRIKGESNWNWQ